jgi:hypothetical protein
MQGAGTGFRPLLPRCHSLPVCPSRRPPPRAPRTLTHHASPAPRRATAAQTLAGVLRELEQTDEHELYAPTAAALAALRTHADEDVRLLVACCLADVLRIYAPAAPFDADVLHQVSSGWYWQLWAIQKGSEA